MSTEVLAKVIPGVKTLEPQGDDTYKAISDIKLGPVRGSFSGQIEVRDKEEPVSFTLKMKQKSKIGNVAADGKLALHPLNDTQTEVKFSGDAKISGTLARTGQRVLSGVAKTFTNMFFDALEKEIEATREVVPDASLEPAKPGGFWARIVQWFKKLFGG